ncbi:class I SAM-dependent methyltransferase [Streptacidiphilus sp. P02-A3a]|nr:class I SAM-dependent methyltransferase [Streptacidiphilus sp. P02-A3a]
MRAGYRGTGPGAITPDGCSVELYERIPVGDEPEVIAAAVPAGATILELGCGVGRVTHPLAARGFTVTAVDESAEMLERVRGVRTVRGSIETLELDERFDVVLLGSFLVHAGDLEVRRGLLRTCRRYVADGGCVLIQRQTEDPNRYDSLPVQAVVDGGVHRLVSAPEVSPGVREIRVEYVYPDAEWSQTFLSRQLTAEAFEAALAEADLAVDVYLTPDHTWVRAVPL